MRCQVGAITVGVEQSQRVIGGLLQRFGGIGGGDVDQRGFQLSARGGVQTGGGLVQRGTDDGDVGGIDGAGGQCCRACREHRFQDLTGHGVPGPEVAGRGDAPPGFGGAEAVAGGQHIGPGFPADLMRGGPVHQRGQDPVINRGIGAGLLLPLGQQAQQLRGVEHREIGVQQRLDRRGTVGARVLHRFPTAGHITVHESNIRATTDKSAQKSDRCDQWAQRNY